MSLKECKRLMNFAMKERFVTAAILAEEFCHDAAVKARKRGDRVEAKLAEHYSKLAKKQQRNLGWKK
jgi:hypothetical protein